MRRHAWRWLLVLAVVAALVLFTPRTVKAVMLYKKGVDLSLQPEMARALPLIEAAHEALPLGRGAIITSGTEGHHSAGSLHYAGYAVDLRSNDLTAPQVDQLVGQLRAKLNGNAAQNRPYQVVTEEDHLHIEYQPYAGWRPA